MFQATLIFKPERTMAVVIIVTITTLISSFEAALSWPTASQAALAAAHRYTILANMLRSEVGLAILYDRASDSYSYSPRLHYGDTAITIDTNDPQDVPPGYVYVGTWHAHVPYIDSLDGHIATIRKNPSIAIWTSYQGYVVEQFWDPSLNQGRGGVHAPLNICPENRTCVPSP